MTSNYSSKNAFLTQLTAINLRSREFPTILAKLLGSQEGMKTAMTLQGDDALTLVNVLDQAFEAPNMSIDLRRKSVRILRRVCGSQTILPRSCILSDGISKESDSVFASGGFADLWKGRHNRSIVCIKEFRAYTTENLSKIKQRLFQEIVIWRRLSHPNVLPVFGVAPKLSPLCLVTEWMVDGNIMDFTSKHPEANRLRLLAEAANGLQYLHSMEIIHSDIKPANILIDSDFHPRLTDYGLVAIVSDPSTVDPGSTTSPSVGTVRYTAPELLNPSGFGLKDSNPTKKSDVYAFGMVTYQVLTRQQPFPGAKDGVIIYNVVSGDRPERPPRPNEWVSDNTWDFIGRCWSPSSDDRPDLNLAMKALNDGADDVEVRRRKSHPKDGHGGRTFHRQSSSDGFLPNRESSARRAGEASIHQVLQPPSPLQTTSRTPSPFVAKAPVALGTKGRRRAQTKGFRTWHDSTGTHWQEAAFEKYEDGVISLRSADGALLEIPEGKLSQEDQNYLRSQDVYKKAQRKALSQRSANSTDSGLLGIMSRLVNLFSRR